MTANHVMEAALKLPPKKRGELLSRLIESLDGPPDPDAPALWEKEIDRRLALIKSGKAKFVDGDKLLARLKLKYAA